MWIRLVFIKDFLANGAIEHFKIKTNENPTKLFQMSNRRTMLLQMVNHTDAYKITFTDDGRLPL